MLDRVKAGAGFAGGRFAASLDTVSARRRWGGLFFLKGNQPMLRIYPFALDLIVQLRPVFSIIERKDRNLGNQFRRCSSSTTLNLGEGAYSRGKNRAAKFHIALGSAREMLACLETAAAFGYIGPIDDARRNDFNRLIGTLVRLVERCV